MQRGNAWNALFWCNHDQPRIVSRFGNEGEYWKESAKMLAGMIHLMRGTPYIYQGEEIGMTNPHYTSIEQYADVESRNYYEILLNEGKQKRRRWKFWPPVQEITAVPRCNGQMKDTVDFGYKAMDSCIG